MLACEYKNYNVVVLVPEDNDHNDINSDIEQRNHSNGQHFRRSDDVDAIDGENSPLQSKRSSRFFLSN